MEDHKDEQLSKDIETIFLILDEKEMIQEKESLTQIINTYNSGIDGTISILETIISASENMTLKVTDILFGILATYSSYCFAIHRDLFGIFLSISCVSLWALRDKMVKLFINSSRE